MVKNDFQYGGWNSYTLQCCTIMTLISVSPGDCTLQCGMWLWNHDSEFTKWKHSAMWYVALGWHAIEFARWQHPAMWHVALGSWHWIRQVAAPCNQVLLAWHAIEFVQTSAILEFYFWFRFRPHHHSRHVILHQSPKFYPNRQKNDVMSIFKMSAILDFYDPIMGFLKSPCTTSYRSSTETIVSNCLVLGIIAFLHFGDRRTNKQANIWTNLSL